MVQTLRGVIGFRRGILARRNGGVHRRCLAGGLGGGFAQGRGQVMGSGTCPPPPPGSSGAFVPDADDVQAYREAVERLRDIAMSPTVSTRLIAEIANELEHPT